MPLCSKPHIDLVRILAVIGYESMKIIALSKFTSSTVTSFHYHMFHGRVLPTDYERYIQGQDLRRPLRLERNGWYMPDVFLPTTELVVSERVRSSLAHIQHARFDRVEFTKLVNQPFRLGDDSHYTPSKYEGSVIPDPQTLFDRLPDVSLIHSQIPPYYEMGVPRLNDVKSRYDELVSVSFRPKQSVRSVEISISRELIEAYKVVWCRHHLFDEETYRSISSYIDWDYFEATEFEV